MCSYIISAYYFDWETINYIFSHFKESTKSINNVIRDECQLQINKYNMKQFTSSENNFHFCMALKSEIF